MGWLTQKPLLRSRRAMRYGREALGQIDEPRCIIQAGLESVRCEWQEPLEDSAQPSSSFWSRLVALPTLCHVAFHLPSLPQALGDPTQQSTGDCQPVISLNCQIYPGHKKRVKRRRTHSKQSKNGKADISYTDVSDRCQLLQNVSFY